MADWKLHHAEEAEKAHEAPLLKRTVEEFVDNMKRKYDIDLSEGLPHYGLCKCMSVAMQVARAESLGFDPELLRLSNDEATEQQLEMAKMAAMAAEQGIPVWALRREDA